MYICPTCQREFLDEQSVVKHLSKCWKEYHPFHISNEAPRSDAVIVRSVTDDISNFFEGLNDRRDFS